MLYISLTQHWTDDMKPFIGDFGYTCPRLSLVDADKRH